MAPRLGDAVSALGLKKTCNVRRFSGPRFLLSSISFVLEKLSVEVNLVINIRSAAKANYRKENNYTNIYIVYKASLEVLSAVS